jgi:hypothetical protein
VDKKKFLPTSSNKIESQDQYKKKYNAPLLTEWGNLQDLTNGSSGDYNDQHGNTITNPDASTPLGKRLPGDYPTPLVPVPPVPNPFDPNSPVSNP